MTLRFVRTLLPLLALAVAGCYKSVPIAGTRIAPETRVRVELTDRGSLELGPRIGNIIQAVEGNVVESNDSTLTLAMRLATDRRGIETPWQGEIVQFSSGYVARVSERRVSKSRSWLMAAGVVVLAFAAAGLGGSYGDGGGGDGGNPQ